MGFNFTQIVKKSLSDHGTKINEALGIKIEYPPLNKNIFDQGSLFTLNFYYWIKHIVGFIIKLDSLYLFCIMQDV